MTNWFYNVYGNAEKNQGILEEQQSRKTYPTNIKAYFKNAEIEIGLDWHWGRKGTKSLETGHTCVAT